MDSGKADEAYQDEILPHVSRTFALTIPQLPSALRVAVTNAYLLCRIADTIEDERALIANMGRVLAITAALRPAQRAAIERCLELMCYGMPRFQSSASLRGLVRMSDLDDYCYYVAGVVGDMLTELFCDYSPRIAERRGDLLRRSVSFAQGLQMTNILKDVWEDRGRGACWLPQEVFAPRGVELARLTPQNRDARFDDGLSELIGVAHAHLRNALDYTLLIPPTEVGIRRFCLWATGLAVLTLQKIANNPGFTDGRQVKITRRAVALTRVLTNLSVGNDWMLRRLFNQAAQHLPLARLADVRRPQPTLPSAERFAALDLAAVGAERTWCRYGGSGT